MSNPTPVDAVSATETDPTTTPTTPPAIPTPPPAPAAAPTPDPAIEQALVNAQREREQATTERDQLHAALRRLLDPEGAQGEADPAALAEQATAERDAALTEARRLRVELAAHQAAHAAGADPGRLLDSRAVERQLAELDPTDGKFAEQLDSVIGAAVEAHPHLRAAPAPSGPPRGGADFSGGSAPQITPQQFAQLSYAQRVELHQSDPETYRQLAASDQ
ncbi:hypothetical protein ACFY2W_23310 [Streptomyces sp. NPDC001262]|uniref:hypothetical protein n=1 Tax=Streptomyces sp. NPDC001262 TaxID=3364552 RepID=UPI0036C75E25